MLEEKFPNIKKDQKKWPRQRNRENLQKHTQGHGHLCSGLILNALTDIIRSPRRKDRGLMQKKLLKTYPKQHPSGHFGPAWWFPWYEHTQEAPLHQPEELQIVWIGGHAERGG